MILGTSSDAGKSFVAAALCRLFSDLGYKTAPFKAQNMSNNSSVTADGGEIGRAQWVQAECARVTPSVHMNPILLKPSQDNCSQAVVQGSVAGSFSAREYYARKSEFQKAVRDSYEKLAAEYEVIVMEGAGSPAEINLKQFDLVNMKAAEMADARCLLVADIDRGGVFASIVGTIELLEPHERERIDGILINRFRGDQSLFEEGVKFLEQKTGIPVWGILPYMKDIWIDEEDGLNLKGHAHAAPYELDIAVVRLPHISNFTDFGILSRESGVHVRYVSRPAEIDRPDLLILPGTKSTIGDYEYLQRLGFPAKIKEYTEKGGRLLGICGGFQMMGREISDADSVESSKKKIEALGYFDMVTEFQPEKTLKQVKTSASFPLFGKNVSGEIEAYEIHMGTSCFRTKYSGFGPGGAISLCGNMAGTYYHGLFDSADFRESFLQALAEGCGKTRTPGTGLSAREVKEKNYTLIAKALSDALRPGILKEKWGIERRPLVSCPS